MRIGGCSIFWLLAITYNLITFWLAAIGSKTYFYTILGQFLQISKGFAL